MGVVLGRNCFGREDAWFSTVIHPQLNTGIQAKETHQIKCSRDNKGRKIINQYITVKNVKKKPYWKVELVTNLKDRHQYIMKIFNKPFLSKKKMGKRHSLLEEVLQEINIHKQLHHLNIVRMVEILDDPSNSRLYTVMEYMEKGSLENFILKDNKFHSIPEAKARKFFLDILLGLEYLHKVHVIHRDIKPENLLLDKHERVKISDFGTALLLENEDDERLKATVGSPAFMPPELCANDTFAIIGSALDIWSLGVTLYLLVFGKLPFVDESRLVLFEKIKGQEVSFPTKANPELIDLLSKLLEKDPIKRITIPEIKQHSWLSQLKRI